MNDAVMATYARLPVTFTKGKGAWLWDDQGKKYLDALAGIAVTGLGHSHPAIAEAIAEQAVTLVHTSNVYGIAHQFTLAERLTALSGMDKVFFSNSGAEANEAAIKIARLYGRKKEVETPTVIVMENSFHGRTMATLSATGNRKVRAGFEPLVKGFVRVPYGDIEAVESVARNHNEVVAVLVEPVQGEGGVNIPEEGYLKQLRTICDKQDWLLMLDEIQTGLGRTGKMFAHQHEDIVPDVMTLAKALGNGVPIGACLAHGKAADLLVPGSHGSTYGGNPLACRAGLATLDIMQAENIPARAGYLSERIVNGFKSRLGELPAIMDIRSKGMMIGIELDRPCAELVGRALEAGLLINVTAERVIRLLPPMILNDAEADQIVGILSDVVTDFLSE